jgi:signal transduction histidine kinase
MAGEGQVASACLKAALAAPRVLRSTFLRLSAGVAPAALLAAEARATTIYEKIARLPTRVDPTGAFGLAIFLGLVIFATTTALIHMRQRRRWMEREAALAAENADLRARGDRADVLLAAEPQIVVAWGGRTGEPEIEGDIALVAESGQPRRVLTFGSWLAADKAQAAETAVDRLKERGEAFRMTVRSSADRVLEIEGRPVMGRAVLRIREISGDRLDLLRLTEQHVQAAGELAALRQMIDAVPQPMWLRDPEGRIAWVNAAYVEAVEGSAPQDVAAAGVELLERHARDEAQRARQREGQYHARVPVVVAGQRRLFDVVERNAAQGSVGVAVDVTDLGMAQAELNRQAQAHSATLDQIPTAVAIFDAGKRLRFCNAAYRDLWQLDETFIEAKPTHSEILDRLRHARVLPEEADYRKWKTAVLETYGTTETQVVSWYLPDGRTLRVVTNLNPDGGSTYLFDDVTERFQIETRFNSLVRVQGETLDTLKEGVAVFGMDGRLTLANPAFSAMWRLEADIAAKRPHIDAVISAARRLHPDDQTWNAVRAAVTGLHDIRQTFGMRLARVDGTVLDCAAAPLPDGATLITFLDMTASVNVERALTERNDALERAGELRESFVHHVSYELRSPLTNVIGFTQLLAEGTVGPLNARQKDYAGHILRSSAALLAIIDDILDLATIDRGAIELQLEPVDIRETISAAVQGVQDRLAESKIRLVVDAPPSVGRMIADGKRLRQILFNLLSNAIGFSQEGQTVTVTAVRSDEAVTFRVRDEGRGIPPELLPRVFDRFESHTKGSAHRGVGLGLSIVQSFVELHGGTVDIQSAPGRGTVVTCTFPVNGQPSRVAAE